MSVVIKTNLVKMGNSQGIRLPRVVLEQAGLSGAVTLEVQNKQVIIRPAHHPRQNWQAQFAAMAAAGDDQLLDGDTVTLTEWESKEWEW